MVKHKGKKMTALKMNIESKMLTSSNFEHPYIQNWQCLNTRSVLHTIDAADLIQFQF